MALSWFKGGRRTKAAHGEQRRKRPQRAPLYLEPLEDRTLLTLPPVLTGVPTWQSEGPGPITGGQVAGIAGQPVTGAISAVAADLDHADIVYIGSVGGGVWKTEHATDPNPHWETHTDQFPSLSITALAIDPIAHQTVYAGTGSASSTYRNDFAGRAIGILKSIDAGSHWQLLQGPFAGDPIQAIVPTTIPQAGGRVVLVATDTGLFRSTDGGNGAFEAIHVPGLPDRPFQVTDLEVDPSNPMRLYAAVPQQGVFRSDNGGVTWSSKNIGITGVGSAAMIAPSTRIELAVSPVPVLGKSPVYAAFVSGTDPEARISGFFHSLDLGESWTPLDVPGDADGGISPGGQADTQLSIVADLTNPDVVFVGGDRQAFPNTGGATDFTGRLFRGDALELSGTGTQWQSVTNNGALGTAPHGTGPHADSRGMVFDHDGNILEIDDGGIYRLRNPNTPATRVWESVIGDLSLTEFNSVAWDNVNHRVLGGAQDVGLARQDATVPTLWDNPGGGDGSTVAAVGGTLYLSSKGLGTFRVGIATPSLVVDGTGGLPVTAFDMYDFGTTAKPSVQSTLKDSDHFAVNATDPSRILFGSGFLYESPNTGGHLQLLNGLPVPVGSSFQPPRTAFVGLVSALVYGGREPNGSGGSMDRPNIGYVGTDGRTGAKLYVRQASAMFGGNFIPVNNYPGAAVVDIAIDPADWRQVYVLDQNNIVWFSAHGDQADTNSPTSWGWSRLTDDLAPLPPGSFASVEVVHLGTSLPVVLLGGEPGVLRKFGNGPWVEYGVGLPNTRVSDIHYDAADDVLLVGTFGRGAWTIRHASMTLTQTPTLTLTGEDGVNDVFYLKRGDREPWLLEVYDSVPTSSSVPLASFQLSAISNIMLDGKGGDDVFVLDYGNGALTNSFGQGSIQVNGGAGTQDQLRIVSTGKAATFDSRFQASATMHVVTAVDPFGKSGTQQVSFSNVEITSEVPPDPVYVDTLKNGFKETGGALQRVADLVSTSLPGIGQSLTSALGGAELQELQVIEDESEDAPDVAPLQGLRVDRITSFLTRLVEEGTGSFRLSDVGANGSIATPDALRQALDGLDGIPGNVTLDQTTDRDGDGRADVLFHVQVVKTLGGVVNLDVNASLPGNVGSVRLNGSMEIGADVALDLTFGVDSRGFFIRPNSAGSPEIVVTNLVVNGEISGSGRLGFLGVDVSHATLTMDSGARIAFQLHDPGTDAQDGLIRLPELNFPGLANLVTMTVTGDPGDGLNDDLVLSGSFNVSAVLPGIRLETNLTGGSVRIAWPDLASPALVQLSASDADGNALLDFKTLKAQQVLDQLFQLRDRLATLTSSPALNAQFQLAAGTALGNLFNAGEGFSRGLLDELGSTPGSSVAGFGTIQDAMAAILGGLDLDPSVTIVARYDTTTGELVFHVPLSHTFAPVAASLDLNKLVGGVGAHFDPIPVNWAVSMAMDFEFGFQMKAPQPVSTFFVRINDLSASLTANASPIHLAGDLGPLTLAVDNGAVGLNAKATVTLTDPTSDGRLSLSDFDQILANPQAMHLSLDGTITVSAGTAVLFPDLTTPNPSDGVATVTGFSGSLDVHSGVLTASANTVTLAIGTTLQVTAQDVQFTIDPSRPDDPIATLKAATVTSPDFPQLPPLQIQNLILFRTGFTLANLSLTSPGLTLKGILDVENLTLKVNNVTFRAGSGFTASDLVLSADRARLFPALPVNATLEDDDPNDGVPGLSGSINLQTGGFALTARKFSATLASLLQINAAGVNLTFDPTAPGSAELLRVDNAVAALNALTAGGLTPTVQMATFGFHQDGTPFLTSAQLILPPGYSNALGVAGLLPLQINSIGINFPDPTDLNRFTLSASGQFLMQQLSSLLGFTPTIQIGSQSFSTTNNGTFSFEIGVDSLRDGRLVPLNLGPITLGIANLTVGGVQFTGQVTLGGYVDGRFDGSVSGFVQATTGPRAGVRIDVLPGSRLDFDGQGGATLDVLGRATLDAQGGIGPVSGSVSGAELNFELKIVGTRTATTPFVSLVVTPTFSDLSVDKFTFQIAGILELTGYQLHVTPNSDPNLPDATLDQVDVSFPQFPLLSHAQLNGVKLFDDGPGNEGAFLGFERAQIDTVTFTVNGAIGVGDPLVSFTNLQVTLTNLTIALPSGAISAGSIAVTGGSATLLPKAGPNGVGSASNITGQFDLTTGSLTVSANLTADVSGIAHLTASGTTLTFGPGTDTAPLLSVNSATLTLPLLGSNVEMKVTDLQVARDGTFSFASAALNPGTALDTLGLRKLLPLRVTNIAISNNTGPRVQLDDFHLRVQGTFDFSVFSGLPAQPIVHLGGVDLSSGAGSFDLTFNVTHGDVTVNLDGPVTLGFSGLQFGPITVGATVTLGHFLAGHFVLDTIGASLAVQAGSTTITASGQGTLTTAGNGNTTLHVNGSVGFSFDSGPGPLAALKVQNFLGNFTLDVVVSPTFQPVSSTVHLLNATVGSVTATLGPAEKPLLRLDSSNVTINLSDPSQPLLTFGSLSATLPALPSAFAHTTGTVSNFSIGQDLSFRPSTDPAHPFSVVFSSLPSPQALGLPAWFPLRVDTLGLEIGPHTLAGQSFDDLIFIVSGGLVRSDALPLPVEASVSGLKVNLGKLANGELLGALQGLDGFSVNVPEIRIGDALKIGGGLGLGLVSYTDSQGATQTALYGRLGGHFEVAGIGAGVEVILSEFGPLLAKVDAPLGLPLGPTGILLTGVSGGFVFGGPVFSRPDRPLDLLKNPTTFNPINLDDSSIRQALLDLLQKNDQARLQHLPPVYSWNLPFTMALDGEFTTVATPGILTGKLNVAANVGKDAQGQTHVTFLGSGEADLFGIQLGAVGALLDLTNPLAPRYDLAFAVPSPLNPLAFLFPAQTTFELHIQTDGLIEAPLIGLRAFVNQMTGGTLNILLGQIADHLRNDLTAGRIGNPSYAGLPLVVSLGFSTPAQITGAEIRNRLLALLPLDAAALNSRPNAAAWSDVATIAVQFANEIFDTARQLTDEEGKEILAEFEDTLASAAKTALQTGWAHFNPSLALTGSIQPVILGIPFGRADSVTITLDKSSIGFDLHTSIQKTISRLANAAIPLGGFLVDFLSLGISDTVDMHFRLGLGDVFASLLNQGKLPTVDPFGQWDISFGGTLSVLGFDLGSIRGAVFAPATRRADGTLDTSHIDPQIVKVFNVPAGTLPNLDSNGDGVPDLIPVATQEQYNNLTANGGLLLTGQLLAPDLLVDPVGLIQSTFADPAFQPPSDVTQLPDYVTRLKNQLLRDHEIARLQLYVPSFASILNVRTSGGFADFALKAGAQAQALMNTAYLSGFVESKLLSVPLGRATVDVSLAKGLQIGLQVPWLAGLQAGLSLSKRNVNFNQLLKNLAASVGVNVDATRTGVPILTVPIPVGAATFSLGSSTLASLLSNTFGLPAALFGGADSAATVNLAVYTPAFGDPADTTLPLVQRNGGVLFDARLNVQNLVQNAQFHFEAPLFAGSLAPTFTATAAVDRLTLPGLQNSTLLTLTNFQVGLVAQQGALRADLTGHVGLLGVDMTAAGTLRFANNSMFGAFQVSAGTNRDFGASLGFKLNGDLFVQINTSTTNQTVTLANGQTRIVAPGARLRVENGALVVGGFALTGTFDLQVSATGLSVTADAALQLFGITFSADGTLQILKGTTTTGLVVDVALAAANSAAVTPGAAAPSLALPGPGFQLNAGLVFQVNTFSTAQTGLRGNTIPASTFRVRGTGSLQLTSSFLLSGTFDVAVNGTGFDITADASLALLNTFSVPSGTATPVPNTITVSADGTLQVRTVNGVLGLVVDVALAAANATGPVGSGPAPSLTVSPTGLGFALNAGLVLQVNTFSQQMTGLRNDSIPANTFRAHGTGDLQLKNGTANSFQLASGTFDLTVTGDGSIAGFGYTIEVAASLNLFGTSLHAGGLLKIATFNSFVFLPLGPGGTPTPIPVIESGLVVDVALAASSATGSVSPTSPAPTLNPVPSDLHFTLNAGFVLQVNTFDIAQSGLRGDAIPANSFRVHATGDLQLKNGSADSFRLADGTFDVALSNGSFSIHANASLSLFGNTFAVNGAIDVFTSTVKGGQRGVALDIGLSLNGDATPTFDAKVGSTLLGFGLAGTVALQVNATNRDFEDTNNNGVQDRGESDLAVPAGTLRAFAHGDLQFKKGTANTFKLTGDFDVGFSAVGFSITAAASLALFGASLTANGTLDVFTSTATSGQRGVAFDIGLALGTDTTPSFDAVNNGTPLNFRFNVSMRLQGNATNRNFRDTNGNGIQDAGESSLAVSAGTFRLHADGNLRLKIGSVESFRLDGLFDVTVSGTSFDIAASGTVSVLGLTMTISSFDVSSSGAIAMSVRGSFSALGYHFGTVTLDLTKTSNVFRLALPSSRPVTVNLGFLSASLSGFVDSGGHFSFSGSTTVDLIFLTGTLSATISDSGFSGSVSGRLQEPSPAHIGFDVGPLTVDSAGNFTFDFGIFGKFTFNLGINHFPSVGVFVLSPSSASVPVREQFPLAVTWTVPSGSWHDLDTVELRVRADQDTILWARFDEATKTLRLLDPQTGLFGPPGVAGTTDVLKTAAAWLFLEGSTVQASGPTSPTVTVTFDVSFQPLAAGRTYTVELLGSDDFGQTQDFEPAGTLTVTRPTLRPAASTPGIFDPASATWFLKDTSRAGAPDVPPFAYGSPDWLPLVGDWDGSGTATVGVFDPTTATWYLKNENTPGAPDIAPFAFGQPDWIPVSGDWNGDGLTTVGVFDPGTATWYLSDRNAAGAPAIAPFRFGSPGWIPVVGDWDGNGTTTIGLVDPTTMTWYLKNTNGAGTPDIVPFQYGATGARPVVGDWDGDGLTSVGVFDPGSGIWSLRNTNGAGAPDLTPFAYGGPAATPLAGAWSGNLRAAVRSFDPTTAVWHTRAAAGAGASSSEDIAFGPAGAIPLQGDWDGNGTATLGAFDPLTANWFLRNSNSAGAPDVVPFRYGAPGWLPVVGDWDGDGIATVGVFDPLTATWYLTNHNGPGAPDVPPFRFGSAGWLPVVGDWDGDGTTTIGVFDPQAATWYLKNANRAGAADFTPFQYGAPGWRPVVGEWDSGGITTVGVLDPTTSTWYFRGSNSPGSADRGVFSFGDSQWLPVVGDAEIHAAKAVAQANAAKRPVDALS